jgi:hypothetical protein
MSGIPGIPGLSGISVIPGMTISHGSSHVKEEEMKQEHVKPEMGATGEKSAGEDAPTDEETLHAEFVAMKILELLIEVKHSVVVPLIDRELPNFVLSRIHRNSKVTFPPALTSLLIRYPRANLFPK